jgi:hypothetical protein
MRGSDETGRQRRERGLEETGVDHKLKEFLQFYEQRGKVAASQESVTTDKIQGATDEDGGEADLGRSQPRGDNHCGWLDQAQLEHRRVGP